MSSFFKKKNRVLADRRNLLLCQCCLDMSSSVLFGSSKGRFVRHFQLQLGFAQFDAREGEYFFLMSSDTLLSLKWNALFFKMFSMESERTLLIRRKVSSQHDDEYATSRFVCVWRPISFLLLTAFGIFLIFHPTTTIKSEERAHGTAERIKVVDIEGSSSRTVKSKEGFPSFLDFANKASIHVGYDSRSILLNGERVLLLGGSLHPSRATRMTWEHALDEVVNNGLNLITLYVMWADHQPVPTKEIDWNFPKSIDCDDTKGDSCEWNLSSAIRSAARRGLFVHIRIGPYDCAEYSYGGIPEWIPLKHPNMAMRRPNAEWLGVMQGFVKSIITYLDTEMLWAHQGGPIILGQIENELGGDIEDENEDLMVVNSDGKLLPRTDSSGKLRAEVRNATLQDYADWCGRLVQKLAPNVTWVNISSLFSFVLSLSLSSLTIFSPMFRQCAMVFLQKTHC